MVLLRWVRVAGFGLAALLVAVGYVQSALCGCLDALAVVGGIATLVLWAAIDRARVGWIALVPAVLISGAVVLLTGASSNNLGWLALLLAAGYIALVLRFVPGLVGWLVMLAAFLGAALAHPDLAWASWASGSALMFWGAWAARHRIELLEHLHRAEEAAASAAMLSERQRLAGDLHDIVAHTLAVTVLHLGGARLALAHEPAEAEAGIAEAERLARQGMTELRSVVRLLAADGLDGENPIAAPQPSAADLPTLFAEYRRAGLDLSSTVTGELPRVGAPTGLVLYRLVQEAVANASHHAPGRPVQARVEVTDDGAVTVEVDNPRPPRPAAPGDGMGLGAMGDRVRMVGGRVTAGPEGRRWVVRAELPA